MQNSAIVPDTNRPAVRQEAILDAAFVAFATYGFRRTAMDDIAKGVGLSRSALYLHFRSKEDIFQCLVTRYFDHAASAVAVILEDTSQSAAKTLAQAFFAYDGNLMEVVLGTPHGAELLEVKHLISATVIAEGEARVQMLFADWLRQRPLPAVLGDADMLAATLLSALKGLKQNAKTAKEYQASQAQLASVLGLALGERIIR
jgi:AcrR family transcriptional regulator